VCLPNIVQHNTQCNIRLHCGATAAEIVDQSNEQLWVSQSTGVNNVIFTFGNNDMNDVRFYKQTLKEVSKSFADSPKAFKENATKFNVSHLGTL